VARRTFLAIAEEVPKNLTKKEESVVIIERERSPAEAELEEPI
jgi:hypothetical protein